MSRDDRRAESSLSGARSKKRKNREPRTIAAPRASFEELEIHASDGAVLRALVDDPPAGVALRGTLVLAHAMFARKSSFGRRDRPGLSSVLTASGFRTIAFDFRGHGESTPPSDAKEWGYDDLVRLDLPAVVDCARARGEERPVIVVGHSLGGHVALAAQGLGLLHADAIVAIGANVWLRELEPSRVRWGVKKALARVMLGMSARVGTIPARRLRIGSDDASDRYVRDLFRVITEGVWSSLDGRDDYLASLSKVTVPVAAVLGERDRVMCHPASGEAFARRCGGPIAIFRAPVGHMELVTGTAARSAVTSAIEWVSQTLP